MINCGYHGNDVSADLKMVVFVHSPQSTYLHTENEGGLIVYFQLCITFSELLLIHVKVLLLKVNKVREIS